MNLLKFEFSNIGGQSSLSVFGKSKAFVKSTKKNFLMTGTNSVTKFKIIVKMTLHAAIFFVQTKFSHTNCYI